jgi:ferredoxin
MPQNQRLQAGTPRALPMVMAHVITQKCVGTCDSICVDVCPVDCIVGPVPIADLRAVPAKERGVQFPGIQMFIDPDQCIDCGMCLPECPAEAIYEEADVPSVHEGDIVRNAAFFRR